MVYGASNQDVREFTKTLVAAIHTPATFIMKEIAEVHHLEKEKKVVSPLKMNGSKRIMKVWFMMIFLL